MSEIDRASDRAPPWRDGSPAPLVVASALWLWALAVALPALEIGVGGWLGGLRALSFPLLVTLGVLVERRGGASALARGGADASLFVLAPLSLVGALAAANEALARDVIGGLHASLVVVAAGSYLAAITRLRRERTPIRGARASASPVLARARPPAWSSRLRHVLVALVTLGAIGLVAIAPLSSGYAERVRRFGPEGGDVAALLAGAVGLVAALLVVGAVLVPTLRAPTSAERLPPSRVRWLALLLVAFACLAARLWLLRA